MAPPWPPLRTPSEQSIAVRSKLDELIARVERDAAMDAAYGEAITTS